MHINELLERVAARTHDYVEIASAPRGARRADLLDEAFVPPQLGLEYKSADGLSQANVILVYAPAAVGKSVMARYIAKQTRNPYWDLAAFRLGSSFFNGNIAQTYGVPEVQNFVSALTTGQVTLILDGADEAYVGSTSSGYFAAISDLANLLRGVKASAVQALIFGREETIMDTAAALESQGLTTEIISVRYFAEDEAREFVEKIAKRDEQGTVLPDFYPFLSEFFQRVMEAFASTSWNDVESFLGYAPVLDAVATFYRTADNAFATLRQFSAPSSRLAVWDLLYDLILAIMERDRDKFANSFGAEDELKRAFAASAYEVPHQCRLLLSGQPQSISAEPVLTEGTDVEWLSYIDPAVNDWFGQHPFTPAFSVRNLSNPLKAFANAAFRDFVIALSPMIENDETIEDTANYLRAHDVNPSIMLSRFVEVRAKRSLAQSFPERLVAALLDSHAAGSSSQSPLWLLEQTVDDLQEVDVDEPRTISVVFGAGRATGDAAEISIKVDSEIVLGRHLTNVVAVLPNFNVAIGEMFSEAQIGPSALVKCRTFSSRSPEARVSGSGDDRVVIDAAGVGGTTRIVHGVPESLALRVPPTAYPWQKFRTEISKEDAISSVDLISLGLEFRTIAKWFTQGSGKFLSDKMDAILAKGRASRWMFLYCLQEDVVWRDGREYRFRNPFLTTTVQAVNLEDRDYKAWLGRAWKFRH